MVSMKIENFGRILTALAPILSQIPNQVHHDSDKGFQLRLEGFYKDGSINIYAHDKNHTHIQIDGRYEMLIEVFDETKLLDHVIRLQASRFQYWNSVKPDDFKTIDENWLPLLIQAGLVKKTEIYTLA